MFRIDAGNQKATKDAYPAVGSPGYFQDTNPAGGTIVPAWWVNQVQEELIGVLSAAGLTPDKPNDGQLATAIASLISASQAAAITAARESTLQILYPVGEELWTRRAGNPSTWLGFGTWQRANKGKFLVAYDDTDIDFDAITDTGGSKTIPLTGWGAQQQSGAFPEPSSSGKLVTGSGKTEISEALESLAHATIEKTNLPPYVVRYCWIRTA